jgi:hypothetical protein
MSPNRRFQLVLIKPSHYDDDGYVIRWWRSMIPSNSLAALFGIAVECAERRILGPNVVITIQAIDAALHRACRFGAHCVRLPTWNWLGLGQRPCPLWLSARLEDRP